MTPTVATAAPAPSSEASSEVSPVTTPAIITLPMRVPLLSGEGLDSWLDALAGRHGCTPGWLLAALGLGHGQHWIRHLVDDPDPSVLRRLEQATGLWPGQLNATVTSGTGPGRERADRQEDASREGAGRDRRAGAGRSPVADRLVTHGSRFCPECLAETGGRWLLSWRLTWSTTCLRHERLLADGCPVCRAVQRRVLTGGMTTTPPAACARMLGRSAPRCGADLTAAHTPSAPAAVLAAQRWVDHLHTHLHTDAGHALRDLRYVTTWLLRVAEEQVLNEAHELDPRGPIVALGRRGRVPALDAPLVAVLLRRAQTIIGDDERAGIAALRSTVAGQPSARRFPPPRGPVAQWPTTSPRFVHRYLRAVDGELSTLNRLRCRSLMALAARPDSDTTGRARTIPQQLWPDWAGRLLPLSGHSAGLFRSAVAALLLVPGARTGTMGALAAVLNSRLTAVHMAGALHDLSPVTSSPTSTGPGTTGPVGDAGPVRDVGSVLDNVLILLCRIADHLDHHTSPIDYQRRRDLIPIDSIDWQTWRELAFSTGTHPGDRRGGRLLQAQRHLHHLLTGSDLDNPAHPLHFQTPADRTMFIRFTAALPTPSRSALHDHAESVLRRLDLDEPVTWSPPAELADGLLLPGIDSSLLDGEEITRLLIDEQRPVNEVADLLGVHPEHIRLALERLDRRPDAEPAAAGQWRRDQQAAQLFTREFFEREYLHRGRSLAELAAETGFPSATIARQARRTGTVLRRARMPIPIDPDWLRTEYRDRMRSIIDIATEIGVSDMTVHKALVRFAIPTRPPGVGSRTVMIATLGPDVPVTIRAAVEGTLHGWQRLHRFQTTMACPTIATAAGYLHTSAGSLVRQIGRLEEAVGTPLFHRAALHRPHKPTELGQQLLDELDAPSVEQLMTLALRPDTPRFPDRATIDRAQLLAAAPARRPRPRSYPDNPVARLRMTRTTLTVLADVHARHPAEFYGHELQQRLAIGSGTICPLLKQLEKAGWLTSRPEDEAEWLAGAPPGRGPGRRRTYYQLTLDGHRAAAAELRQPRRNRKANGTTDAQERREPP